MGLKGVVPDRIFRRIHFLGCGRCRVILRQLHTEFGDESHWDPPEHNVLIFVFTHSVLTTRTSDEPSQRSKGLTIYKPSPGRTCRIKWMYRCNEENGVQTERRVCVPRPSLVVGLLRLHAHRPSPQSRCRIHQSVSVSQSDVAEAVCRCTEETDILGVIVVLL